jgi:hypothetical protein
MEFEGRLKVRIVWSDLLRMNLAQEPAAVAPVIFTTLEDRPQLKTAAEA